MNELKNLLSKGANGSKILVTTRSNQVVSIMGTMKGLNVYNLQGLSDEICLSLFLKRAFDNGQEKQYPSLIKIGEEIVKKCGGTPLAVITLGSLLYSSIDERDWMYVRDNEIWNLEQKQDDILPALKLSYDQLPSYLKPCFAYCSLFPKDYEFQNFEVIYFWMAHGLLPSSNENQDLENIGMPYLKELVSRSFFQDFEQHYSFIYTFKIHDLMHDLAASLMKSECLRVKSGNQVFSKTIRHLSFADVDTPRRDLPSFLSNLGHVRSITFFPINGLRDSESIFESCISRFQFLRVLNLMYCKLEILPKRIGNLMHLRYLCLSGNHRIKVLPNSICNLQNLQTLILDRCEELKQLPKDIRYLISLRALSLSTNQKILPENGVGCLSSLRVLGIFECKNLECLFKDIRGLRALRTLIIVDCPNLISLPCGIKYLSSLENLILDGCKKLNLDLSMGLEEEDDHQDHNNIRSHLRVLVIIGLSQLVELPRWLLQVSGDTLQSFYIANCSNFKALPKSMQNLQSLKDIRITSCPKLLSLPKYMNRLAALRELKIEDCPELSKSCEPRRGEDWSKIAHIPKIELDGEIIKSSIN